MEEPVRQRGCVELGRRKTGGRGQPASRIQPLLLLRLLLLLLLLLGGSGGLRLCQSVPVAVPQGVCVVVAVAIKLHNLRVELAQGGAVADGQHGHARTHALAARGQRAGAAEGEKGGGVAWAGLAGGAGWRGRAAAGAAAGGGAPPCRISVSAPLSRVAGGSRK